MKLWLFILFWPFFSAPGKLTIVVSNIEVNKGSIVLAVFNVSEDFLEKAVAQQTARASSNSLSFQFDLPEGDYAIAIYQDENENKKLDKNWIGIPKERYGFSNNFRPRFSAPDFDDCKFKLKGQTTTTIVLK